MKYIISLLLVIVFFSCKEKKSEHKKLVEYADSLYRTTLLPDTNHYYWEGLTTPFYSIEARKLDTVIALLKEQNKLLKKLANKPMDARDIYIDQR